MFKIGDIVRIKKGLYSIQGPLDGPMMVTEITERGFKYRHPTAVNLGSRIGTTQEGETFVPDHYELAT